VSVEGQLTIVISSLGRTVAALGIVGLLNVLSMIHAAQQRGKRMNDLSEATAPRLYSWLPVLISVMTVVMLAIGGIAIHYTETRMLPQQAKPWPLQLPKSRINWTDFCLNGKAMCR